MAAVEARYNMELEKLAHEKHAAEVDRDAARANARALTEQLRKNKESHELEIQSLSAEHAERVRSLHAQLQQAGVERDRLELETAQLKSRFDQLEVTIHRTIGEA